MELSSLNEAKTFGEKFQREKKAGTKQQDNQGSLNYHTLPIFFFLGGGVGGPNQCKCMLCNFEGFPIFESALFWVGNIVTLE